MIGFLYTIGSFLLALMILIAVHEYGHFWVARKMGVKVLRFSIGFGQSVWSHTGKDGTEYVLAWIPLGGYVKMVDEREGDVDKKDLDYAFNRQSLAARSAIVFAGPAFNLLFAVAVYWMVAVIGTPGFKPIIGDVVPASAAAEAGIAKGDLIKKVGDQPVSTWSAVRFALLKRVMDGENVVLHVETAQGLNQSLQLDLTSASGVLQGHQLSKTVGLESVTFDIDPRLSTIVPEGRAEQAGFQSDDLILAADGQTMHTWNDWLQYVRAHPEITIDVQLERQGEVMNKQLTPASVEKKCQVFGYIGAGAKRPEGMLDAYRAVEKYSIMEGFVVGLDRTWSMSVLMLKMMGKIVTGQASVKNISGPIMIAQVAGKTANAGFMSFVTFLAIISVSLGVLNLLPIPMLDGGHLFYFLMEFLNGGKAVSEEIQIAGQKIGIVLLLLLMTTAVYQDINRFFDHCDEKQSVVKTAK
jgi:regulator of sigma E protease